MRPCPQPWKEPYRSARAARRARSSLYTNRAAGQGRLVLYRCGNHWHIGHQRRTA